MFAVMKEIYEHRNLLKALIVKNLKGQYKNSHLGFLWQFATPILTVILFYVVFTSVKMSTGEYYWVYLCVGVFPFDFMNKMIHSGSLCIVNGSQMIKKMYFPREIVPLAFVLSNFITFIISYAVVLLVILIAQFPLDLASIALLPIAILLSLIFAFGLTLLLSSVTVYVRDISILITVLSRVLFWVTPLFYELSSLTGIFAKLIWVNPFTYFVNFYQNCVYYSTIPSLTVIIGSTAISLVTLFVGAISFTKLKRGFAERI